MELMAEQSHLREMIEHFVDDVQGAGVAPSLVEALGVAAPPARGLAPRLLELLPGLDEQGRFSVASLAVALAADPGYRVVAETVVADHRLEPTYRSWLVMRGARLDGDALRWWLDLVADRLPSSPVDYALHRRREIVLRYDRDTVAMHLLRHDNGPACHSAELAVEVLCRGGPCPPVEELVVRWIREGRFDGDVVDAPDGTTSAQVLASCLERGIVAGPFTERWSLALEAVAHWRELLSSGVPERRRRGLACMTSLLTSQTSLAGMLPWALADRDVRHRPEWRVIEAGFSAVNDVRRASRNAGRQGVGWAAVDQEALILRSVQELAAWGSGSRSS